jgi:putative oxidoreductase
MTPIRTAARALLGALFVGSGVAALRNPGRLVSRAKPVTDQLTPALEAAHLPTDPETLVKLNGAVQVAGGLMLVTGHFTRPAATALAASLVPTTIAGHPFWTEEDPQRKAEQRLQFAKNLGLLGGLLYAAVDRGGRPSVAWRAQHAAKDARRSAKHAGATAGLAAAIAAQRAKSRARNAGDAVTEAVGNAAWRASGAAKRVGDAATHAGHSARRSARTARREARLAVRAVQLGRRLPF